MDEFQLQLEILAIENGYCMTVLICYCYSCVYVKAAKQYIETCVVRVQKMHSMGVKALTTGIIYTYYCSCSNVGSCIYNCFQSPTPPGFTLQPMKSWGCGRLGMWLECTQDHIRNTMMQHAGCILIEPIMSASL